MDVVHNDGVDGFGLVSSDSDFTRLAPRSLGVRLTGVQV
ncbi:hypothetical protein [Rhodoferax sp. AJA081-3]|nr:hypothetical protein [Rhodoferax sp. AJA081-3]